MKKIKGFTLIECIIAIAILGIASLTMAQIYAGVSRTNLDNNLINTSLANQMKLVEKEKKDDTIKIESGEKNLASPTDVPPHMRGGTNNVKSVKFTRLDASGNKTDEVYSYPIDMYVLLSRDSQDRPSNDANANIDESDINLRYRFFVGGEK